MSDHDLPLSVIVLAVLLLIPSREWIDRRIRSERARRVVLIGTWLLALAAVAIWLVRVALSIFA
jgi:hypothetical protein